MAYITGNSAANRRTLDQFHAASRGRAANAKRAAAGYKAVKTAQAQQRKKKSSEMSEEDKRKEKIRKRRIELQKTLSRPKSGKKVRDEKDIAAGPRAAFPVKNRKKRNSLRIKDD